MTSQTVRAARGRLVRYETVRVYSYKYSGGRVVRCAGVYGKVK